MESAPVSTQMSAQQYIPYDLYSMTQYPWWCLNYFIIFWLLSTHVHAFLLSAPITKVRAQFGSLDQDKRNNVTIYLMQLLGTSVALAAQLYGSLDLIFLWQDTTSQEQLNSLQFAVQIVAILYIWELIYRKKIGLPLLVHHLVTVLLIQLSTASFFDTRDVLYMRYATLLGFHATVEQLTFLALFFFRLNLFEQWQSFWFFLSAAQSLLFKTAVTVASVVYYVIVFQDGQLSNNNWGLFWKIFTVPLLVLLYSAQVYACLILYRLGKRCQVMGDFEIQKSVMTECEEIGTAQLPVSKSFFREESEILLAEYETNQRGTPTSKSLSINPDEGEADTVTGNDSLDSTGAHIFEV